jgi:hypothetical protein
MKHTNVIEPTTPLDQSDTPISENPLIVKHTFSLKETLLFIKHRLLYIVLIAAGIGIGVYSQHPEWFQEYDTSAATNTAQINLQPSQLSASPNAVLQIWTTTNAPTGFVSVEIDFTPSLIKLTSDVALTSTSFTRIIKRTSYTEANSTGKIILALGLDPAKKTNPPQGSMQLATINFAAVSPVVLSSTDITISGSASSVVGMDTALMNISTTGTTVSLPIVVVSPTPTSSISIHPTPTATPARTNTPIPTPIRTKTLTPTLNGNPTATPTLPPEDTKCVLTGTVYNEKRNHVVNTTVIISRSENRTYTEVARLKSDANGQYQIPLACGTYQIRYSAHNFRSQLQTVNINSNSTEIGLHMKKFRWTFGSWWSSFWHK